jgi:hypothetical protein
MADECFGSERRKRGLTNILNLTMSSLGQNTHVTKRTITKEVHVHPAFLFLSLLWFSIFNNPDFVFSSIEYICAILVLCMF